MAGGSVHQLFAGPADLNAAWDRYAELARAAAEDARLGRPNRDLHDRMLRAEAEYKRLFEKQLEAEGRA
jgi:hypothetical protein